MKAQSEIQSAAIARGTDRVTHETFYVIQSDTDPNTWYQVRWNAERLMWCCNCPAHCDGCKHQRATLEVLRIRRATIALAMGGQTPAIVARMQSEEDRKVAERVEQKFDVDCIHCRAHYPHSNEEHHSAIAVERRQHAPLNGNRPLVREHGIPMR